MPYIDQEMRKKVDPHIDQLTNEINYLTQKPIGWAIGAGVFTYIIYRLLKTFNQKYWVRALGFGCLLMAMMEMYRTEHSIYEEGKRTENGDV